MPRLTPISWRDLILRLRKMGFDGPFQGGKHPYMIRDDVVITVPNPHRRTTSVDLLSRILRQAGVSRDQWLAEE